MSRACRYKTSIHTINIKRNTISIRNQHAQIYQNRRYSELSEHYTSFDVLRSFRANGK